MLVPAFITSKTDLFQHHISSFNSFLQSELPKILQAEVNNVVTSDVEPRVSIRYKNINVLRPVINDNFVIRKLLPWECRMRDLTYSGQILSDLEIELKHPEFGFCTHIAKVEIGKMPIMVGSDYCWLNPANHDPADKKHPSKNDDGRGKSAGKNKDSKQPDQAKNEASNVLKSKECPMDPTGYFIIRGVEKVLLMQEQLCRNKILVDRDKSGILVASCASATLETKSKAAIVLKSGRLWLKSNSFKKLIPFFIVVKAMGGGSDKRIAESILPFNEKPSQKSISALESIISLSFESLVKESIFSDQDALVYLTDKIRYAFRSERERTTKEKVGEVLDILSKVLIPHVPAVNRDFSAKRQFIVLMAKKLLRVELKLDGEDENDSKYNRDFLGNKRIECAGEMIGLIFEDLIKFYNSEVRKNLNKTLEKWKKVDAKLVENFRKDLPQWVSRVFLSHLITEGLADKITSGKWSIKRFKVEREGVTQVLARMNYLGTLGMLTRLESHVEKSRKIAGPRSLQCSHFGYICPVDTPDGENCGLVKNLALLAKISVNVDDEPLFLLLKRLGLITLIVEGYPLVMINGKIAGCLPGGQVKTFVARYKECRTRGRPTRSPASTKTPSRTASTSGPTPAASSVHSSTSNSCCSTGTASATSSPTSPPTPPTFSRPASPPAPPTPPPSASASSSSGTIC